MGNFVFSKEKSIKYLFLFGLFLFSVSLLFPFNLRNLPVIVFGVIILLAPLFSLKFKSVYILPFLINSSFFAIMSISILYSENNSEALKRILVLIPMLIIPLCFSLIDIQNILRNIKIKKYFQIFFFSSTVIFLLIIAIYNYDKGYINETLFIHYPERMNFAYGKYSMHPIYISMYISIALFLSIPIFYYCNNKLQKVSLFLSILVLSTSLLIFARKGPIIFTALGFIIYFFLFQKNLKNKLIFILFILVLVIFASIIEPIRVRFLEFLNVLFESSNQNIGSTSIRLNIYKCTIDSIKESVFFGYGIGDVSEVLNECYLKDEKNFPMQYHNSHNQYLSSWLASGIFGFTSLILMIFFNLKKAFKSNIFLNIIVLGLFVFMMLTENILERQDGVLLVSFFTNFLYYNNYPLKNK